MATLQKIRNNAGVLIAVIIGLALFAFVAGDILRSGSSIFNQQETTVAQVNDGEIEYTEYSQALANEKKLMELQGQELNEEMNEYLRNSVWEELLLNYILEAKYEELGLAATNEEIQEMVWKRGLDPLVRQFAPFMDPQTGQFSQARMQQILMAIKNEEMVKQNPQLQEIAQVVLQLEQKIKDHRKRTKYYTLISKGLFVTSQEAQFYNQAQNERVDIEYIMMSIDQVADNQVEVSESDIKTYYEENKERFRQEETRGVEYITFMIEPSEQDYKEAEKILEDEKEYFAETKADEMIQYLSNYSAGPIDFKYYTPGKLPATLDSNAWAADSGTIIGPIQNGQSFALHMVMGQEERPDSVHILTTVLQGGQQMTPEQMHEIADSLITLAKDSNRSFEESFGQHQDMWISEEVWNERLDTIIKSDTGSYLALDYFRQGQFLGLQIIKTVEKKPQVNKILIASLHEDVIPGVETEKKYEHEAYNFERDASSYEKFKAMAEENNKIIRMADNLTRDDQRVAGLPKTMPIIRWAYEEASTGSVKLFRSENMYILAALTTQREEGYLPVEEVQNEISQILLRKKKAEYLQQQVAQQVQGLNNMEEIAAKLGADIHTASNLAFSSFSIAGAGIEPKVVANALSIDTGKVSQPIAGNNGVFILRTHNKQQAAPATAQITRMQLRQNITQRVFRELDNAILETAEIEDRRLQFGF